jgi:hypothetical protein
MSTSLAIAAVTATLRRLLEAQIQNIDAHSEVTTQPPDKAFNGDNKLNLFLYHIAVNGNLRNLPELPGRSRPGETLPPPLALDLYYLLTAYGKGETDLWDDSGQRLLGRAISFLNDNPVLLPADLAATLADARVQEQIERVRITLQLLSHEEMSKLWTTFQTQYRLSVAYLASVVLIEGEKPARTPLPVLSIGKDNRGVLSQVGLSPALPTLTALELPPWSSQPPGGLLPAQRPSAQLGDTITLHGLYLEGAALQVIFSHPRLAQPHAVAPLAGATARAVSVALPNQPAAWPAGIYTVSLALTQGGQRRQTASLPLVLAPAITNRTPASTNSANFDVTVTFTPEVQPEQQVRLLFGSRELEPNSFIAATDTLVFPVNGATPDRYPLRLRVDGVDSQIITVSGTPPVPVFDPAQVVEVTP